MPWLLALLVSLAVVAAACGGDDDAVDQPAPTTVTEAPADVGAEDDDARAEAAAEDAAGSRTTTGATVPTDAPAGEPPAGAGEDDGLGDALLVADLTAEAVVPGPGATGGWGRFEAELVDGRLCVDLVVDGLGDTVEGAHVHEGADGQAGPPIVDLGEPSETTTEQRWVDSCIELPDDVIARVAAAPEQHHVAVHTTSLPDGAVRGQLAVTSVFDRTLR